MLRKPDIVKVCNTLVMMVVAIYQEKIVMELLVINSQQAGPLLI